MDKRPGKESDSRRYGGNHGCADQRDKQVCRWPSQRDAQFGGEVTRLVRIRLGVHERNTANRHEDNLPRLQSRMGRNQRVNKLMPKDGAKDQEKQSKAPFKADACVI